MMNSVLCASSCGYFKIALYERYCESSNNRDCKGKGEENSVQFEYWQKNYSNFPIKYDQFGKLKDKIWKNMISMRKSFPQNKDAVIKIFSSSKWLKMSQDEKRHHTKFQCRGCLENEELKKGMSMFIVTKNLKKDALNHSINFIDASKMQHISSDTFRSENSSTQEEELVKNISELVPPKILKKYNTMVVKKTVKKICKTSNEKLVIKQYGSGISLRKNNTVRLISQFESKEDAMERTLKAAEKIASGQVKAPNPIGGDISRFNWNKADCLAEVKALPDGAKINFSELARNIL